MTDLPYEVPQGWRDSLEELRDKVKLYPEDPEDLAIGDNCAVTPERQARIRELAFNGELQAVIYAATNDPDLEV